MTIPDRIELNPDVLVGKPVVKGTRISVELILSHLASGWSREEILESYPHLSDEDIQACLRYAYEVVSSEVVSPSPPPS